MERKIGETFDYNGKMLEVVEGIGCEGCYFQYVGSLCSYPDVKNTTGLCSLARNDGKNVIFKEIE